MNSENTGFDTKLVHAGAFEDQYGSATVPIYQTSTFAFRDADHGARLFAGANDGFIYTRIGNPTIKVLEDNVAQLENGFGGIATSSGMGAVSAIYMSLLGAGAHVISSAAVYGPSRGLLEKDFSRFGVEASFIDTSDLNLIRQSIRPNTKMLFLETPANPTMTLTDIEEACKIAHEHNLVVVVDNTFASPYLQKPLDLGADVVFHSVTKFLNGHADVVGGVIVTKTQELYSKVRHAMVFLGTNMDPHSAFLVIRGIKTLSLRVDRAQENAMKVATFLENHPKVAWIKYPGLASFPQHELAKKQMSGFGAMISFGVKGGFDEGKKLMNSVKLALLAVSLGGVESLIQHPASMTHAGVSHDEKIKAGISDDLIRYSVGIENVEDIIHDLEQALAHI